MRRRLFVLFPLILLSAFVMSSRGTSADKPALVPPSGGASAPGSGSANDAGSPGVVISPIVVLTLDGPVNPATAEYVEKGLAEAAAGGAGLVVLRLDTPGGLMDSMRRTVKAILACPVPVAVWIAPSGARAASAGVFITLAAPIAAMAPGTNIGAAHPVTVGKDFFGRRERKERGEQAGSENRRKGESGEKEPREEEDSDERIMAEKILADTVAYARSLAEARGRNADWAERAVRKSLSSTEQEALREHVVDLVAPALPDLLRALEGRMVDLSGRKVTLRVEGAPLRERPMDFRLRVLAALSDPNVAYILLLLGFYGLIFELASPGAVIPGIIGALSLILAFFSFQVLPVNFAGILLMLLAVVLFLLEVKVTSYGMLGLGGTAALVLGSLMLFSRAEPWLRLSLSLVLAMTAVTAFFFLVLLAFAVKVHRRKVVTGAAGLVGEEGTAATDLSPEGKVHVHGEIWNAVSSAPAPSGTRVRVTAVEGLTLKVQSFDPHRTNPPAQDR